MDGIIRGYKAFEKGMRCRGKQYKENTVFEEETAKIYESGMHFCKMPFDVLDYYGYVNTNGEIPEINEFAEVEALDEVLTDDNKKYCTKKLKIGAKIDIAGFVKAQIDFILSRINKAEAAPNTGDYSAAINTGYKSAATNTGDYSVATNTGYKSAATNTGNKSAATNTSYRSAATNTGDFSAATNTGDFSAATNTGDYSAATNTGFMSAATVEGKESIAIATGIKSKAKGSPGCWIVLAEWEGDHIKTVKSHKVDGEIIKANTFYTLTNGDFKEVEE
ncbi:MAG: hypothetical protein ACI4JA_06705 [Oscillospiraceae bacterium]